MRIIAKNIGILCIVGTLAVSALFVGCNKGSGENDNEQTQSTAAATEERKQQPVTPAPTLDPSMDYSDRDASELSLKDAYSDYFPIGVAVNSWQLSDKDTLEVVTKDFSTFTTENEMKPDYLLDHDASMKAKDGMPEITTEKLDEIMTMAEDAGLKMRGHTLVWHSQTPDWLFYEDYDTSKKYVDKDTMLKRMEAYIKKVMTFCKENHPGVIVAWDVANETISDNPGGGFRTDSPWYEIIGDTYLDYAFTYARKYAEEGAMLFLNDYGLNGKDKRETMYNIASGLFEKGLLDGIGMQSHHDMELNVDDVETSMFMFSQIKGIQVQLTELDIHNNDNSDEAFAEQAQLYGDLFKLLVYMDKNEYVDVTGVTFWGLNDDNTWLTGFRKETSYPLLFDKDNKAKPCYFAIYDAAKEN